MIFDADILRIGHWGIKVEVLEVNGAEPCAFARENTVEQQLEEFKGRGVGADISWVTDMTASDGDAGTIRTVFIMSHFTHYHGVAQWKGLTLKAPRACLTRTMLGRDLQIPIPL